jgi:hypothetical protein
VTMTDFVDADIPEMDTVPETEVEYKCKVCGREAGPYGGRGPKPKLCPEHKKVGSKSTGAPRVSGTIANQAAQATAVLSQLNGMIAIGAMAMGLFETGSSIGAANDLFEKQAYEALLTDPELCKLILKGGVKSGKLALGIAYAGMGMTVVPTAVNEMKEKKAERDARREAEANEAGTTYA